MANATRPYLEALPPAYAARRRPAGSLAVRIQQIRSGALPLVALPFQVLAELGLRVKERVPEALVTSYANGYEGLPPISPRYSTPTATRRRAARSTSSPAPPSGSSTVLNAIGESRGAVGRANRAPDPGHDIRHIPERP